MFPTQGDLDAAPIFDPADHCLVLPRLLTLIGMAPLGCPAHFASGRFGRHVKREVLAEHLKTLSQRLGKVPEFANYATDGPNMRTTL